MKLRSGTVVAVIAYVIVLLFAVESEDAGADPYIELGSLINESDATAGGIGYTYNDKWDINRTFIGEGETDWGKHPPVKVWSISRLVYPEWTNHHFFMGIGVAKLEFDDNKYLVDDYNYKLQIGWDFGRSKIYYHHYSSADINELNTGIDAITIQIKL